MDVTEKNFADLLYDLPVSSLGARYEIPVFCSAMLRGTNYFFTDDPLPAPFFLLGFQLHLMSLDTPPADVRFGYSDVFPTDPKDFDSVKPLFPGFFSVSKTPVSIPFTAPNKLSFSDLKWPTYLPNHRFAVEVVLPNDGFFFLLASLLVVEFPFYFSAAFQTIDY